MDYGEASYFDGFHFAHIAAWEENRRMRRIARKLLADPRFAVISQQRRGARGGL